MLIFLLILIKNSCFSINYRAYSQAYGFRDIEFFKLKIKGIHLARYALVGWTVFFFKLYIGKQAGETKALRENRRNRQRVRHHRGHRLPVSVARPLTLWQSRPDSWWRYARWACRWYFLMLVLCSPWRPIPQTELACKSCRATYSWFYVIIPAWKLTFNEGSARWTGGGGGMGMRNRLIQSRLDTPTGAKTTAVKKQSCRATFCFYQKKMKCC